MAPDFALNEPRSRDHWATIARRSWFLVFRTPPSDENPVVAHDRASNEDLMLQKPPYVTR